MLACLMVLSFAACGKTDAGPSSAQSGGIYTPGTYTGEGQGYGGTVTVTLTVDANSITDVKITGDQETPAIGGAALEELAEQVKTAQSAEIDGVAGASFTSKGVREAAEAALAAANGEEQGGTAAAVADGTYTEGTPVSNLDDIMAMGEKFGNVIMADSLQDLGSKLGTAISLSDVHGQTEGKIYCIKGAAYVYSTCGGLDVDTNMNLLKEDGTPMENVFVVGNNSLGVLNKSNKAYVTHGGAAQGWALTSGRLAGENAAKKYAK